MTYGEMQIKTRRRLNATTATFISDDDIQLALNEGYAEMGDATEFYERHAVVPMLKKRTYYDLSLIFPDTFLSPRRIYNPTTSQWLIPTDPLELDSRYSQWELVNGEPSHYFLRGNWWLGVWPRPTADNNQGLRFYYSSIAPALSDDLDEPEFPREYHEGIVEFALGDCEGQRRETQKALGHWNRYIGYQEGLAAYVDGRQRITQQTVLGGQQIGR